MNRRLVVLLTAPLALTACISTSDQSDNGSGTVVAVEDPGDCIVLDAALSPEKITLFNELATEFNGSDEAEIDGNCIYVRPFRKSSGAAATALTEGWDPTSDGEEPEIWSPAATAWGTIVNQRTGREVVTGGEPFMLTPLVIAMPEPMAEALGYPEQPIGFADLVALSKNAEGWAAYGHPEWGPFRLGKTNPNFSTSGLNFTIAQYYAATGKTSGLTIEDLDRADAQQFATDVESAVVHYGDTTLTFLNNWYRADARGTALTYASAVAIEEKSILDYNSGNPDGIVSDGEEPKAPRVPLVAIYPTEGTLFSDNPFFVVGEDWVTAEQQAAAEVFLEYIQRPENQEKVLEFGFRPGNPSVAVGAPIIAANGVDPDQPQAELEVPDGPVLTAVLDAWAEQRKTARVLIVLDVSGSMGEDAGNGQTKLDLAKQAAQSSLDEFKDDDEVGLWVFTTDIDQNGEISGDDYYTELVPVSRIGDNRDSLRRQIDAYLPLNGTPLYDVTGAAHDAMKQTYDGSKINAVVMLTDGVNDDGETGDDADQLTALVSSLRSGSEGSTAQPVRVFTISYGADADTPTLKRIAEATNAALYDASDPQTIEQVFTNVVSNF